MATRRILASGAAVSLLLMGAIPVSAHAPSNRYAVTVLQTKGSDPDLVNGWGVSRGPGTPWWVSDNGSDKSTLYNGAGAKLGLTVTIPGGAPTGTVFNGNANEFNGDNFLFDSEAGIVSGWRGALGTTAEIGADRSAKGAIYKGLALASWNGADYLYATDFHNNRIDVFNSSYVLQNWSHKFRDPRLPAHYGPFGIQALNGLVFVTYAHHKTGSDDELDGAGLGIVDVFLANGQFLSRVATRGALNAPWGIAWSPSNFGRFSDDVLVGNFGNGRINAYHWTGSHWVFAGTLRHPNQKPIVIHGLWGIAFGGGTANNGPLNSLYYAAGPNDEDGGAFGVVNVKP